MPGHGEEEWVWLLVVDQRQFKRNAAALLTGWVPLLWGAAPGTIVLDGQRLAVEVYVNNCRWSAGIKGAESSSTVPGTNNVGGWRIPFFDRSVPFFLTRARCGPTVKSL